MITIKTKDRLIHSQDTSIVKDLSSMTLDFYFSSASHINAKFKTEGEMDSALYELGEQFKRNGNAFIEVDE